MSAKPYPIPITIIAGFLGAGKTTLLNRILRTEHGLQVAVLVNDFGEIDIDAQLLAIGEKDTMISLPNGCICCTLFGNLVNVIQNLVQAPEPPEYIIIEASGVSSPKEVAAILEVSTLHNLVTLDSIVTVVDAENVRRLSKVVMFSESQIRSADILLVNKIDLIDTETLVELIDWIQGVAPDARILQTSYSQVPLDLILGVDRQPQTDGGADLGPHLAKNDPHSPHQSDHGHLFVSWSYATDKPLDRDAVQTLLDNFPASVYRGKGFLYFADSPEHRFVLQIIGKRVSLLNDEAWGAEPPKTELVFIGDPGAFDPLELQSHLDNCLA
jgi:G3E family GTPase